MPDALSSYERALMRYRDGRSWECVLLDPLFQEGKSAVELLILPCKGVRQQTFRNLFQKLPLVAFVFGL